jgi:hypothetical protein
METPTTGKYARYFYRCDDCLTVVVTLEPLKKLPKFADRPVQWPTSADNPMVFAECGCCGGDVTESMGVLKGDYSRVLITTEFQCPCDGKCTGAKGPSCDCPCGGKNHGTNAVVEVEVSGRRIPRVLAPKDGLANAEEFRALRDAVQAAWDAKYKRFFTQRNESGSYEARMWSEGRKVRAEFHKVRDYQVHGLRMKGLRKILNQISPEAVAA